jgi:outer membrane protein assembly factor BamB
MKRIPALPLSFVLLTFAFGSPPAQISDWPDWRGPLRDGQSIEKGLPARWSPAGENLLWKAPLGGRSTPIVEGARLYLQNGAGKGATLQERIVCLNADTGKLIWEYKFNVHSSDVPPHRIGWASPAADPATGNVYANGVGGHLLCLSKDGKLLWERSLSEEFGMWTTHGGRTVSPIIEGDLVIISGPNDGWGEQSQRRHRFFAFNKRTGECVWASTPGQRPYDTTYAPPVVAVINGTPLLITGGGDGATHAMKLQTGEPVWSFTMAKRGINTGVVIKGTTAIVSHSEENIDTSEMGLLAALDATSKGQITKDKARWATTGWQGGFSSPIIDGDRIYQVDNGANLFAFDVNTGKSLWQINLGTIQKASPVLADGKLYVGSENGRFFILRPGADKCEILDEDQLGTEGSPEQIIASVAVSRGRVYLVTDQALYCIGRKNAGTLWKPDPIVTTAQPGAAPAYLQITPTELMLRPGQSIRFHARLFDEHGLFIREEQPQWSLAGVKGDIKPDGTFTASSDAAQVGLVKATAGNLAGAARVRVIGMPPYAEDFESYAVDGGPLHWVNITGKYLVREVEGNKALMKQPIPPIFKRARAFVGWHTLSNYTVEADVRATMKRRQMGDAGVVAQRYTLVLFGNHQHLELQSWQPETQRTVKTPFEWKPNKWYRLKLEVQTLADGKVRVRGKAWTVGEAEPEKWLIEKIDSMPNLHGSPGIYGDTGVDGSPPNEVYFDNFKVTPNK